MAKPKKLTPARLLVSRFGMDARKLSKELGFESTRISVWICRGGKIAGGQEMYTHILDFAKQKKVQLSLEELVYGGN